MQTNDSGTGIVLPWERDAIKGAEMPPNLSWADQVMYLSLRMLYAQERAGIIARDTAVKEKRRLLIEYDRNKWKDKARMHFVRSVIETEKAKSQYLKERTIENADLLISVMDGMEDFRNDN